MTRKISFLFSVLSVLAFGLSGIRPIQAEAAGDKKLQDEVVRLRMELEQLREEFRQFQDAVRRGIHPPEDRLTITGFDVQGTTLPKDALDAVLKPLTEKRHTLDQLQSEVKRLIQESYSAVGIRGVQVAIPPQEISDEPLVVQVVEPILGNLEIRGNRWFGDKNIRRFFEGRIATSDGVLVADDLEARMEKGNRHPDRQITALLEPGEEPGETDVTLDVHERKALHTITPFHYSVEINNTGTPNVGRLRLNQTFQYTNFFDRDQTISVNWQWNPSDFRNVQVVGGSYLIPLGTTGHNLSFYGGYSQVATNAVIDTLEILGEGWTAGTQFSFELPEFRKIEHRFSMGAEVSALRNNLEFGSFTAIRSNVGRLPVNLRYSMQRRDKWGATLMYASYRFNFDGIMPHGELTDFKQFREEASSSYFVSRFGFERYQRVLGPLTFHMRWDGQYTSDNLIPAEQYRIGGIDSVRGYEESEISSDSAFIVRSELRLPATNILLTRRLSPRWQDEQLQVIGFVDYGLGRLTNPLPGDPRFTDIAGAGLGLRYQLLEYFLARIDFAWALFDATNTKTGDAFVHFSAQLNF